MPAAWIVLVVVLWLVIVLLVVLVLGLMRRVEHLEGQGPRRILAERTTDVLAPRLTLGSRPPAVAGYDSVTGGDVGASSRLFLFLSSSCDGCNRLAEEIRSEQHESASPRGWLGEAGLVLITDADGALAFVDLASELVVQTDEAVSRGWGIPGTPYAVVVSDAGVIRASGFASRLVDLSTLVGRVSTEIPA